MLIARAFGAFQAVDTYDLRARQFAAGAVLLPALAPFLVALSDAGIAFGVPQALSGAVLPILYAVAGRAVRVRGRAIELGLFESWGGRPSLAMLRHRDTRLNPHTKARIHARLNRLGDGFHVPTAAEELQDPAAADVWYDSCSDELRRRAKAAGTKAVARENISYGFTRNLLALKSLALAIAAASILAVAILGLWHSGGKLQGIEAVHYIAVSVVAIYLVAIWRTVTPAWVRLHAEAYARELLATAEALPTRRSSQNVA